MRAVIPSTIASLSLLFGGCGASIDATGPSHRASFEADHPGAPPAVLELEVSPLYAGSIATYTVAGAEPEERVYVMASGRGPGPGLCPSPLGGLCLDVAAPARVVAVVDTDATGAGARAVPLPYTLPTGEDVAFQAVAIRGAAGESSVAGEPVLAPVEIPEPPAIAGTYVDFWGTAQHIGPTLWDDAWGNAFVITQQFGDANDGHLVARNSILNAWFPGRWSRFDWTEDASGRLYYCQTAFDADTEADALATAPPDATDPSTSGCAGFAWTHLQYDAIELAGTFVDEWGTEHTIDDALWEDAWGNAFHIADYSNHGGYAIAQNDADNAFNPNLWSRFDWTEHDGHTYYCQTAYDAPSQAAALGTPAADPTDPTTTGCFGFAWTNLTP